MQIIPTTGLQKDFFAAEERITKIKDSNQWIQVDVCDNVFNRGKTFELELLNKLSFNADDVLWDIHLMVKEPIDWIEKCLFVGANRITGQVEMMTDREKFVKTVKDEGLEAGLAFDIATEVDDIPEETDIILLMGRKAGFGEYPFEEKIYKKIETLRQFQNKRERKYLVAVDGGVTKDNLVKLKELGVDIVYSGNNYFELNDQNN
jgi:ribulose-phosphate 3-epimerase